MVNLALHRLRVNLGGATMKELLTSISTTQVTIGCLFAIALAGYMALIINALMRRRH
jgi:hypothetical protein